ncbi:MAG: hypothetical protein MJ175_05700, partial [Clostridia bacterium]|nr:hypothetical protein [Clostridia bacterium]
SAPGQDFYRRLSGESSAFGQLMNLANGKMPTPKKAHTFANAARRRNRTNIARRQPDAAHPIICPRCRNANLKNACYCESCGLKLR